MVKDHQDAVEEYLTSHGFPLTPESALSVLTQFAMLGDFQVPRRLSGQMALWLEEYVKMYFVSIYARA
jgi:hypothetical protein